MLQSSGFYNFSFAYFLLGRIQEQTCMYFYYRTVEIVSSILAKIKTSAGFSIFFKLILSNNYYLSNIFSLLAAGKVNAREKHTERKNIFFYIKNRISRKYEKAFYFNTINFFYFPISIFCYNGNK
jgi:hypothetical protein